MKAHLRLSSSQGRINAVQPSAARPFSHFLALSVAVHALLLSELGKVPVAEESSAVTVLNAELVTLAPVAPPVPALSAPVPPAPRAAPRVPRPMQVAAPPDSSAIAPPQPVAEPTPAAAPPEPEVAAADAAESAPEPEPRERTAQTPPGPVATAEPSPPIPPVRDLPETGSQSYEVFIGTSRLHIGKTLQTWTITDQTYRLSSISETTGLASLFRPYQLDYLSEGRVDASGFQPESFSVRRGRNGARQYAVRFDWSARELTLGPVSAPRKIALPEGTYDVLSFIYQLARAQLSPGQLHLNITTGNRLETYTLEVGAEEDIEVPTGTIRALPVRQVRTPGQEGMELWLSPQRQYLPVRIRFFDRQGEISGEQLAADIAFHAR